MSAYQQPIGPVHGHTSREAVMNGQVLQVSWRVVASLVIHVPSQVKVYWVAPKDLLP